MQIKAIPSKWIENEGYRLDCGPYMSGAIEAREILKKLPTKPLHELTTGHNGGIFNGPRFPRTYVADPEHGVPFLGSVDILHADLSHLSLLSKKQVVSNPDLLIDEGWTLITCSGTIGRMCYARADMAGMAGSQHFMRVVPNEGVVKPGYLYSFLSSRFGVPQVIAGTYGAIIQHIEPHHLADLPVPRLGEVEERAHDLVQQAADLRVEANEVQAQAIELYENKGGLSRDDEEKHNSSKFGIASTSSRILESRMDALFHSGYHTVARQAIEDSTVGFAPVDEIAQSIKEPLRFKRVQNPDNNGIPFFGTSSIMWFDPVPNYHLYPRQLGVEKYIVDQATLLVPRSGQLSGVIGIAVLPYGRVVGGAVTEDAIRVTCLDEVDAGFLFIALRSEFGIRQLKARAYGSSIPHLDVHQIGQVSVLDLHNEDRKTLGRMGLKTAQLRDQAIEMENQARLLIEDAIEEGA